MPLDEGPGAAFQNRPSKPGASTFFPMMRHWRELPAKAQLGRFAATIFLGFVLAFVPRFGAHAGSSFKLLGLLIAIATCEAIYRLCGRPIPVRVRISYMLAIAVYTLIATLFVMGANDLLIGAGVPIPISAGFVEEASKFVGVLIVFAMGRHAARMSPYGALPVGVREPLEGIYAGFISGAFFALIEALVVYTRVEGPGAAISRPLLTSPALHAATAGLFGYFFGLGQLRQRRKLQFLLVGYLVAAAIHTIWDFAAFAGLGLFLLPMGIFNYALLGAAILKARKLSPTRADNFATTFRPSPEVRVAAGPALQLPARRLALKPGLELLVTEIPGLTSRDGNGLIARVERHASDPARLGLCNLSGRVWMVTSEKGTRELKPGQVVAIREGIVVNFGEVTGQFHNWTRACSSETPNP